MNWFSKNSETVLKEQGVDAKSGLTHDEARNRLEKFGRNELQASKKINPFALFLVPLHI